MLLDLSSSDFLPSFQKLRLLCFEAPSASAVDVSGMSGSAEDLEDAGKAAGRRGVRDPRDSAAPMSPDFTDCSCCARDMLRQADRGLRGQVVFIGRPKYRACEGYCYGTYTEALAEANVWPKMCEDL